MKRFLLGLMFMAGTMLPAHAAEPAAHFAQRLHQHLMTVRGDARVVAVAREASPSNVTVEFQLDPDGRVDNPKIVHSILSQDAQRAILAALGDLPPIPLDGYAAEATYRLPLRLEYTEPAMPAQ
ncbi:hypothetical protein JYU29_04450 [Tianweitania sp. BSSL-BM11]|uniref:TonB C-terminal domain-containing protein n=1 Tax=Tianweitania aestuarii TaxID=2814886 RepID=A0ABS5RSE7_9HYPH|nr:energy transducer TonB [Tianweitania aestuarii]MBS9719936.1 hypothetical protein [Tianweitania aestuarii]